MYLIGKGRPFSNTLRFLKCFLFYVPSNADTSKSFKWRAIMTFIVVLRLIGFLCCCLGSLIHLIMFQRANIDMDLSENFPIFVGGTGMVIVCIIFPFYSNEWSNLFTDIARFTTFGKPDALENTVESLTFVSTIFSTYNVFGALAYCGMCLAKSANCNAIREQTNHNMICIYATPIWLPMTVSLTTEWIIFSLQTFQLLITVVPAAISMFLVWEVTYIIIFHMDVLKDAIKNIIDKTNETKTREMLGLWVLYHQYTLRIIVQFNRLTKICMGMFSLIAALSIASVANQLAKLNKPFGAANQLSGWIVVLYILCDSGQKIQNSTISVSEAVLDTNWYDTDDETKKDLKFIILRSQKMMYLQALPLGMLNYDLLVMIMKSSYSYLTLMYNNTT